MKNLICIFFISLNVLALNKPLELRLLPLHTPAARVVSEQPNQKNTLQKPLDLRVLPSGFDLTKPSVKIQSYSVKSYAASKKTDFSITFTGVPDFFTIDKAGRAANSFQFYIMNTGALPPINELWDVIIRGEEIRHFGKILVRNGFPYIADFNEWHSGGWDGLLATVPYVLTGQVMAFSIPWSSFKETDGRFYFELSSYYYGSTQDYFKGQAQQY